jgi:hypothetical protein
MWNAEKKEPLPKWSVYPEGGMTLNMTKQAPFTPLINEAGTILPYLFTI